MAFFVSLFLGSDESESVSDLLFLLFLLTGSPLPLEGPALSGTDGAVLCGDAGAAVCNFFFFLGLLLVGPEVLFTDCRIASKFFRTSSLSRSLELERLSIVLRTPAICSLRPLSVLHFPVPLVPFFSVWISSLFY